MFKAFLTISTILLSGTLALVMAQGVKPTVIVGDVTSIADKNFVLAAKTGPVEVSTNEKTAFKKVSAENPNLAQATAGEFVNISVGDKLTVSVIVDPDGKMQPARTVYFITKADITAKNAKESAEWQRRGVTGKVTAVNAATNQMTLETRTLTGSSHVVVTPKDGAKFLRYAPDSIRFDEAQPSTIGDTKVGDMVRALGDKSSDGLSFAAEQVVAGAFQTVAGTVKSIDTAKNEVVIKNLQTNKDVTVVISDTSVLKRFPAEQAEMLARFQMMGAGGGARPMGTPGGQGGGQGGQGGGQGERGGQPPAGNQGGSPGGAPGGGQGRPGMGGGRGAGGVEDMLERSPNISASDLKVGDTIALSSTKTPDMARIKAIKLFAGVEPFLRAAQATGGRGGRGQGGVEAGFSIPGLDGIGFP
ncbi:MAG: DUF5666 domain-containing protein [Pyrinomonadaceae bacterium]